MVSGRSSGYTAPMVSLTSLQSPSALRSLWRYLRRVPGGGRLLGRLMGRLAPYTGSIRPEVLTVEPGLARLRMADRPRLRNHLRSLHAAALMNLGEATTGLAMLASLPEDARGIPTHVGVDYLRKARGPITAECRCEVLTSSEARSLELMAELTDASGAVVTRVTARWLVGPRR
jgi:acyl-coenzyme A thioesterase PaaI-like protein